MRQSARLAIACLAGWFAAAALVLGGPALADDSYQEQRARLEGLTAEEKEQLLRKKERFEALPPEEQDRLRQLHASIHQAAEADELLAVMSRYNEWLKTLSSAQRAELLSLPAEERIAKIKEIQKEQERQRFRQLAGQLPEQDIESIYAWLIEFVAKNEDQFLERMPREFRERLEQLPDDTARHKAIVRGLLWRRPGPNDPMPTAEDFAALLPRLSEETQQRVAQTKTPDEKVMLTRGWVMATIVSKVFPPISDDDRRKVFARLSPSDRERLELQEPEQRRRELTRMYYAEQFRSREGWRGPWGGPRFGPPDRRRDGRDDDGRRNAARGEERGNSDRERPE